MTRKSNLYDRIGRVQATLSELRQLGFTVHPYYQLLLHELRGLTQASAFWWRNTEMTTLIYGVGIDFSRS
jgi:hypothetical protein